MNLFHYKRKRRKPPQKSRITLPARLMVLLLCLSLFGNSSYVLADEEEQPFSDIADFTGIMLSYGNTNGEPDKKVEDGDLLQAGTELYLRYDYKLQDSAYNRIEANKPYYLEISPHLVLPNWRSDGKELKLTNEDGSDGDIFGYLYANGTNAWVEFTTGKNGTGTVLSDLYREGITLEDTYFYLNCQRASSIPSDETAIDGQFNRYVMKFEKDKYQLTFGYKEYEPVRAKAQLTKNGSLTDKTINWTINYTPWQNPNADDNANGITSDTAFELRDEIDTSKHRLLHNSLDINGTNVTISDTRPTDIPELYAFTEKNEAGEITALIIGGTKFNAGNASEANPAQALTITYQTNILDTLLLPSPDSDASNTNDPLLLSENSDNSVAILNTVELFIKEGTSLGIHDSATVNVNRPTWIEKTGETVRNYGNGSTTTWTVKFFPNGYTFGADNSLTLHDQLPDGSTLVANTVTVKVGDTPVASSKVTLTPAASGFTISPIETANQEVTITYQTKVSEEMYDNSTNLGSNIVWFTFTYNGKGYTTSKVETAVGSGSGSNSSSTAILNKTNSGYDPATRSIEWTVTINPHKSNFTSGTFIDNLSASVVGGACNKEGHNGGGLELFGGASGVSIDIVDSNGQSVANNNLVAIDYTNRIITATVGNIGRSTVTLTYTTKVVDPCLFVNETRYAGFTNWIAGKNLVINTSNRSDFSTYSYVTFNVDVLKKNAPVYDYATGTMTWTVEMNHAGLPLTDITLTDVLPTGLTYIENSLSCTPVTGVDITTTENTDGRQILTLNYGTVNQKTTLTFQTKVDPEAMGFLDQDSVEVKNTINMTGLADGVDFETSHTVTQSITNHGLVKCNTVDASQELIEYEVLINPFGLELPANPTLVDVMDSKLQLDWDTLRLYKVKLSGTAGDGTKKPGYVKVTDSMQTLPVKSYDPTTNSFSVELPISTGDREAYVLTYTADITKYESGGSYTNSISFSGNTSLLGGSESNNASVGGGGGGGGGGIAARKATITITKTDKDNQQPLEGVTLTLYQWNNENGRGLIFAQADTDENGKISLRVKPGATYELVESKSLPNYASTFGWFSLPEGVTETNGSFLITAGQKGSTLELELTNQAHKTNLTFSLVNQSGIPMAGKQVLLYLEDPSTNPDAEPYQKVNVLPDGSVEFPGIRPGVYYIVIPGGDSLKVTVPNDLDNTNNVPTIEGADGTPIPLKGYQAVGITSPEEQWTLTIQKVATDGTTPLAGATLGLYADAACKTLLKEGTSNADGTITFSGLMSDQSYYLKETTAPTGYQLNGTIYTVDKTCPTLTIESVPVSQDEDDDSDTPDNDNDDNTLPDDSGNSDGDNGDLDDSGNLDGDNGDLNDSGNSDGDNGDLDDSDNSDGNNGDLNDSGNSDKDTNSGDSGVFSGSNNSSSSGTSDQLEASTNSGTVGTHRNYSSDLDIPQTGDSTWCFGMLTLLSGLLLAGLTAYRLWARRQNVQK